MKHTLKSKGDLMILGTAFLWSFLGIVTKTVSYHGMTVAGITSLMAVLLLLCVKGRRVWCINRLTFFTALVTAFMNLTFLLANKYTTVANAIVLQYSSPIFVVLYYRVFQHKKLKPFQMSTVAVCFMGLLIFFSGQLTGGNMSGNFLALASGILFAGSFYLNALPDNNPAASQFLSHVICTVMGLCCTFFFVKQTYTFSQTGLLMAAGILCNGLAALMYSQGIRYTTALNANLIAMSEVLMAPVWAFLLFGETLGTLAALGAGLMLFAILCETWFESRAEA